MQSEQISNGRATACLGKERLVRAVAKRLARIKNTRKRHEPNKERGPVGAFLCRYCGHWHMGSQP